MERTSALRRKNDSFQKYRERDAFLPVRVG